MLRRRKLQKAMLSASMTPWHGASSGFRSEEMASKYGE